MENLEQYMNKIVHIKLRGRSEKKEGILIGIGKNWLMVIHIPVDYVIDGFALINKKHITKIIHTEREIFQKAVIDSKDILPHQYPNLNLDTDDELFISLQQKYKVIMFDEHNDRILYIGEIKKINEKSFRILPLSPRAKWLEYEDSHPYSAIRVLNIECDYINSLLAYNRKESQANALYTKPCSS